jgi:hypothetical protein
VNGKVARALRKEIDFDPNNERSYQTIELTAIKPIRQFGFNEETKEPFIKVVHRPVPVQIVECIDGARKVYQYLKRKWYNPDHEVNFQQLPEQSTLDEIEEQVLNDEDVQKLVQDKKWADREAKWEHDKKKKKERDNKTNASDDASKDLGGQK